MQRSSGLSERITESYRLQRQIHSLLIPLGAVQSGKNNIGGPLSSNISMYRYSLWIFVILGFHRAVFQRIMDVCECQVLLTETNHVSGENLKYCIGLEEEQKLPVKSNLHWMLKREEI